MTLKGSSTSKSLTVPATTLLPAGAVTHVTLSYLPLLVGTTTATAKLECAELGVYEWDLELQVCVLGGCVGAKARQRAGALGLCVLVCTAACLCTCACTRTRTHPPTHPLIHSPTNPPACCRPPPPQGLPTPPEKSLEFSVPLGGREARTFRFRHLLDDKTDYKVSFASGSARGAYEAPATVAAPPAPPGGAGVEVAVEVAFEPSSLGDGARDTLVVSSATGGWGAGGGGGARVGGWGCGVGGLVGWWGVQAVRARAGGGGTRVALPGATCACARPMLGHSRTLSACCLCCRR